MFSTLLVFLLGQIHFKYLSRELGYLAGLKKDYMKYSF